MAIPHITILNSAPVLTEDAITLPSEGGNQTSVQNPPQSALDNIYAIFDYDKFWKYQGYQKFVYDPAMRIGQKPVIATQFNNDIIVGQVNLANTPEIQALFEEANRRNDGYVSFVVPYSALMGMQVVSRAEPSMTNNGAYDATTTVSYPQLGLEIGLVTALGLQEKMRVGALAMAKVDAFNEMLPPILPGDVPPEAVEAERAELASRMPSTEPKAEVQGFATSRNSQYIYDRLEGTVNRFATAASWTMPKPQEEFPNQPASPLPWELPTLLAMTIPVSRRDNDSTQPSDTGEPPRQPGALTPVGLDVIDEAAMLLHSAHTLPITHAAQAAVAAADAGEHPQATPVLTRQGYVGKNGVRHDALTLDLSDAALALRAVEGLMGAPQLVLVKPLLLSDGTVSFARARTPSNKLITVAQVNCTATTGQFRFDVGNNGAGRNSSSRDGLNLNDPLIVMNHGWVTVDVDARMATISAKSGPTFAPTGIDGQLRRVPDETQRIVSFGYQNSIRLRFGNSVVDLTLPPADPAKIEADFNTRFTTAEGRIAGSFFSMATLPDIYSTDGQVFITLGGSSARHFTLQMPATIPSDVSIELIREALTRFNMMVPVQHGDLYPVTTTVRWVDAGKFTEDLKQLSLAPEAQKLAWSRGFITISAQGEEAASLQNSLAVASNLSLSAIENRTPVAITIELPDRFIASPFLPEAAQRDQGRDAALGAPRMELRQLSVALSRTQTILAETVNGARSKAAKQMGTLIKP